MLDSRHPVGSRRSLSGWDVSPPLPIETEIILFFLGVQPPPCIRLTLPIARDVSFSQRGAFSPQPAIAPSPLWRRAVFAGSGFLGRLRLFSTFPSVILTSFARVLPLVQTFTRASLRLKERRKGFFPPVSFLCPPLHDVPPPTSSLSITKVSASVLLFPDAEEFSPRFSPACDPLSFSVKFSFPPRPIEGFFLF